MRVGLVGAGFMGGVHLNAYAGIPEVEVVGVADARIDSAVAGAKIVGARPYASYEELVAAEDVEVVDICLPTAFHSDLAVRAAGEARHVILEKPIARTIEDAQEILDSFSGDGPRLFVGHVVRFFPEYVGIKEKIDAGDLGTVGVVRTSRRSPFLLGWNDWYADWRISGGVPSEPGHPRLRLPALDPRRGREGLRPRHARTRAQPPGLRPRYPALRERNHRPRRGALGVPWSLQLLHRGRGEQRPTHSGQHRTRLTPADKRGLGRGSRPRLRKEPVREGARTLHPLYSDRRRAYRAVARRLRGAQDRPRRDRIRPDRRTRYTGRPGVSVRVGLVSFAHVHSPAYAGVLRDLAAADFVGIADENTGRGAEAAEHIGVRFFDSATSLFEEVEAVVVCSENRNHARDVIPALRGGVHVLCEKPISTTVEDARAMIQASEDSESQLRTAFPVRYLPSMVRARELVREGALGRVLALNGTNHGQIPGGWFLDPELAGGGAVMDHTVHLADLLRWMLDAEVKSVYAEVDSFFGAGGTDDAAILTLELEGGSFADGAFATIDPSWSRGEGYPTWGDVTLRISGTFGVLDVDPFAQPLRTFDHETGTPSWSYTGEDMNALMLEDFLRGVTEGEPSGASGLDGLRTLEVVLAAYRSGEDHEPKKVERTP